MNDPLNFSHMIFLPLTVAATVLSGVNSSWTMSTPSRNHDRRRTEKALKGLKICTLILLLNVEQAASLFPFMCRRTGGLYR
jgi:hypothetical protein